MLLPSIRVDKDIFRQIFIDHWDGFKNKYPSYGKAQYEEVVQKMLHCGKESGGSQNTPVCTVVKTGEGSVLRAKDVFVFPVLKCMLMHL